MNELLKNLEEHELLFDPDKYFGELLSRIKDIVEQERSSLNVDVQKHQNILQEFLEDVKKIDSILDGMQKKAKDVSDSNEATTVAKDLDALKFEIEKKQNLIGFYKTSAKVLDKYINLPIKYQKKAQRLGKVLLFSKILKSIIELVIAWFFGFYITNLLVDILNLRIPEYSNYIVFLLIYIIEKLVLDRLFSKLELSIKWKFVLELKNLISDLEQDVESIKLESIRISGPNL